MIDLKLLRANSTTPTTAAAYVGPVGEIVVDTDTYCIRVQDGSTPGGHEICPAAGNVVALHAIGNTTGSSSSTTYNTGLTVSGAGIVSVGYSSNNVLIVSAAGSATSAAGALNLYAVGNTTNSTTSGVNAPGSLTLSGAGIVSVGISGSSLIISAPSPGASGTAENWYALGNTTAATSSSVATLGTMSISGAGGVSVGFSTTGAGQGVIVISGATAVTTSSSPGVTMSYLEPYAPGPLNFQVYSPQHMLVGSFTSPAQSLVMNQFRFWETRQFGVGGVTIVTSTDSKTLTLVASCASTRSLVIYSQQSGTSTSSFATYSSTTATLAFSQMFSVSLSSSSISLSERITFSYPQGTNSQTTATISTSTSTATTGVSYSLGIPATSNFTAWLQVDIPFAATLTNGLFLVGYMGSSGNSGVTAQAAATLTYAVGPPSWNASLGMNQSVVANLGLMGVGTTIANPGIGSTSSVGSVVPTSIVFTNLSDYNNNVRPYFYMGML